MAFLKSQSEGRKVGNCMCALPSWVCLFEPNNLDLAPFSRVTTMDLFFRTGLEVGLRLNRTDKASHLSRGCAH